MTGARSIPTAVRSGSERATCARAWVGAILGVVFPTGSTSGAEVIGPQNRQAFYSDEPIELAVAGLKKGEEATLELVPQTKGLAPVRGAAEGDGLTVVGVLTVSSGVNVSTMLLSPTILRV